MATDATPLRILHLTAGSDAGGLSQYIYSLCMGLHQRGHQVAVAGERGAWHWLFEKAPFPWIDVPLKAGPLKLWKAARLLTEYARRERVDVLHTHYRRATLVARSIQRRLRLPILYTVHLSHIALAGPRRWLSDFGDVTHCASIDARNWLTHEARVPENQIAYIPHGIDPDKFQYASEQTRLAARSRLDLTPDDRVALYVGRLDTPKNEQWIVDVAAAARERVKNLKILMVGEGPHEAQVRKRIAADGLSDRVLLLGHRDPLPMYQAADALLLPSTREGFSLVCAEAMAVGVPVLRTKTSGSAELIQENVTGRAVPIEHDAFVRAGVEFLAQPTEQLRRMGVAASQHVRTNFTFDRQLDQTLALYRRLATLTTNGR